MKRFFHRTALLFCILTLLVLAGCGKQNADTTQYNAEILSALNSSRAANGCAALTENSELDKIAAKLLPGYVQYVATGDQTAYQTALKQYVNAASVTIDGKAVRMVACAPRSRIPTDFASETRLSTRTDCTHIGIAVQEIKGKAYCILLLARTEA